MKIAVAGAGLIAQVEHIPNLLALKDEFEIVGVADSSKKTRAFIRDYYKLPTFETFLALFDLSPDAMLVSTPEYFHEEMCGLALKAGVHVFCEKPLCYSVAEAENLIRYRDEAGKVLQVGYMKRWDPSYEMLLEQIAGSGERLRFIGVEVNDPDFWPFVAHRRTCRADDLDGSVLAAWKSVQADQVENAVGKRLFGGELRGFTKAYCSSMIHDLNLVQGILDKMGIVDRKAIHGALFANGEGGSAALSLSRGKAFCHLAHVLVPRLADYQERMSLFFDDRRFEMIFPSPYLNHFPTTLESWSSEGNRLIRSVIQNGFHEAFVRELQGFHEAVVNGTPVRNSAEEARDDLVLIREFARFALSDSALAPEAIKKNTYSKTT